MFRYHLEEGYERLVFIGAGGGGDVVDAADDRDVWNFGAVLTSFLDVEFRCGDPRREVGY